MTEYYKRYKILVISATLSGLYSPGIEKLYGAKWYIKLLKGLSVFPAVSLSVYFIACLKYFFYDEDRLMQKIFGAVECVYGFFSIFVIYSYYYLRKDLTRAFDLWDSSFQDDLFPEDREVLLSKNRKITNAWLKIFGGLSVSSAFLYSIMSYFNPTKKLEHPFGLPYRNQSPDFELVVTLELFVSCFGFATLIVYDSITMVLLSLEEAQLRHLKISLHRILETLSVNEPGEVLFHDQLQLNESSGDFEKASETPFDFSRKQKVEEVMKEADKKMRIWISHHLQALRFHEEIQKIYCVPFAVKFFAFILIICICSFLIVSKKFSFLLNASFATAIFVLVSDDGFTSKDAIMSTVFCCNNYALFYVNIQFADSIKEVADSLFEGAFGSSWYIYPKKFKTVFQIILMRSQRPLQYTAFWIYPLSSRTFLKIFSAAYSFFTFLLHVTRKKN